MITTFLANTSILLICGLTFDRYVQIFYAFNYMGIVTSRRCKLFILAAWSVAFLGSFIQLCWLYRAFIDLRLTRSRYMVQTQAWYSVISYVLFLVCPLIFIGVNYLMMYGEINRMSQQRRRSIGDTFHSNRMQRHSLYTYAAMFLMFLFLSFPYFTLRLLLDLAKVIPYRVNISIELTTGVTLLKYFTSLLNPILYMNKEYRWFIMKILHRHKSNDSFIAATLSNGVMKISINGDTQTCRETDILCKDQLL